MDYTLAQWRATFFYLRDVILFDTDRRLDNATAVFKQSTVAGFKSG